MNKQKEIREAIITNIVKACPSLLGKEVTTLVDKILRDESSQDVVIKVGEFDSLMDIGIYPKEVIGGKHPYKKRTQWMNGWNAALIEAGKREAESKLDFAAVKPLIEVKK